MNAKFVLIFIAAAFIFTACGGEANKTPAVPAPNAETPAVSKPAATPMSTMQPTPKNGDYPGKGKITKINNELGSVEMNHEEIVGVMPPMLMEFFVTDKALLKGLAVGDQVDFTLKYEDGRETISKIVKAK